MLAPASDSLDAAVEAAREVLARITHVTDLVVLHTTNNVVVGAGEFVAKVTTDSGVALREYLLAGEASTLGAPAFAPVAAPATSGRFTVVVWPRGSAARGASPRDRAAALRSVHSAWLGSAVLLPTLSSRLDETRRLLCAGELDRVLDQRSSAALIEVISDGIDLVGDDRAIIHGEPHDGNFVLHGSRLMIVDFEAACLGPIEWDLAFFPDDVIIEMWPDADHELLGHCRTLVSATVSTYCWRHLAARGEDVEMRSHAQSHLLNAIGHLL